MRRLVFLWLFTSLCWAQIDESLVVSVREMRVHVVDSDGFPVKGLTPSQFAIKVQKRPSEISFFEEVDLLVSQNRSLLDDQQPENDKAFVISDTEAIRNVVLFVDSSHLTRRNFEQVKETLRSFILTKLNPKDQVKIIHWDEKVTHLTGFTSNREKAVDALEQMPFVGRMRREMIKAQRAIDDQIKEWDIVENPEVRYSYENVINQLIRQKGRLKAQHYRTFYLNMLSVGTMLEAMGGPKSIFMFTGGSYLEINSKFGETANLSEQLGRVLNRANATIYTMMIKPTSPVGGRPPFMQNQPPNFTNSFNANSEFPPSGTGSPDIALNTIAEDNAQIETGPAAASDSTGGLFLKSYTDTDLTKRLDQVQSVSSHYYRLAFPADSLDQDAVVRISLKDKQSGWKLLYGKEFGAKKPYLELPKEERSIALSAMMLYSTTYRDDLALDWDAKVFENGKNGYRIAMMGKFEKFTTLAKGLEVGFCALDENRELLDLTTSKITELPTSKTVSFYDVLLAKQAPKYLRFYVRDLKTAEYSFQELEWPVKGEKGQTQISNLAMDQPGSEAILSLNQLNYFKQGKDEAPEQVIKRSKEDPFRVGTKVYAPDVAPYEFKPGVLGFLFHLENPESPELSSYQVQYLIQSKAGFKPIQGRLVASWLDDVGNVHFQGQISAKALNEGAYQLHVRVICDTTGQKYTSAVPFSLN